MDPISTSRRAPFGSNPKVGETGRATQQRILAAATEAFAEAGYARTSVESITDRAGCSRPTFYQYFSGKEDLHRRLAGRMGGELSAAIDRLDTITPDDDGRSELRTWIEALAGVYARYQAVADNFSASVRTDERMVAGAAELSARYRQALVRALHPSATAPGGMDALAEAAINTAYGACLYRDRVGTVGSERLSSALADILHRTFFGPIPDVNMAPHRPADPTRRLARSPEVSEPDDNTRRRRGLETRQRFLDSARIAYGMLGFDAVRVDDIAKEAGMSHGTFYRYFRDKDAIFDELADAATSGSVDLVRLLPVTEDRAVSWAAAYYAHYERHGGVIGCMRDARAADSPGAIRARQALASALVDTLGGRDFGDTEADLVACFSLLENVPAAAYGYSWLSVDDAIQATAVLLSRGLFGQR